MQRPSEQRHCLPRNPGPIAFLGQQVLGLALDWGSCEWQAWEAARPDPSRSITIAAMWARPPGTQQARHPSAAPCSFSVLPQGRLRGR